MAIRGNLHGSWYKEETYATDNDSMRAYIEHETFGNGAIVELYMTPYNTFAVQVMLDDGTIVELVKGAVAGNSLNVDMYGPGYAKGGEPLPENTYKGGVNA